MAKANCAFSSKHQCENPVIIGLVGAKTSGKSAVADLLVRDHGFTRFRFGSGLKDMLYAIGLTGEELEGAKKNAPNKTLGGVTPRYLMETLGDSWGRRMIHPNLWVYILTNHIVAEFLKNQSIKIVIDDVRYPNEVGFIRSMGGQIWRVTRPGLKPVSSWIPSCFAQWSWLTGKHVSEFYWNRFEVEHTIANDGDFLDLKQKVNRAVDVAVPSTCKEDCTISRFWTPRIRE
jgi:hypothetical protein